MSLSVIECHFTVLDSSVTILCVAGCTDSQEAMARAQALWQLRTDDGDWLAA